MKLKCEHRETIVIQKSRFIACAKPCRGEEEARQYIEDIRKEFTDASHVCTAYLLGDHDQFQRSNDDHEPSGTAGIPILEAIKNSSLKDVCVCVVRYFGGIKLGASGLIRAYSGATTQVLHSAPKVEEVIFQQWSIQYPYELSGTLEHWLRTNTEIVSMDYDEHVTCVFETTNPHIKEVIQDLSKGSITPTWIQEIKKEVDLPLLEE